MCGNQLACHRRPPLRFRPATDDYSFHAFGTCKLGNIASDPSAVVDNRLRVRGFKNLRIADGSVIPQMLRAGPMATTYMIGEYAAQTIQDNKHR